MQRLLQSSKFLLLVIDVVISLALFFIGKYGPPGLLEDVKFVIVTLQPVFVAIIGAIAYEDGQAKGGGRLEMTISETAED